MSPRTRIRRAFGGGSRALGAVLRGSAALLTILGFLAGCGAPSTDSWSGTITDSAGVVIVENPARGMWGESQGWTVVEELRIGSFGGDLHDQFGQVGYISVDSRGRIYVSDTQAQDVRVFSPGGEYIRTVGGPGGGPGELERGANFVLLAPGDTLLVPDLNNQRINRYGPDGVPLASRPVRPADGRLMRFRSTASGAMAVHVRPVQLPDGPPADSMDAILVLEPSGLFGDTLSRIPTGGLFQGPGIHYFTPEPLWDLTDSLTVVFALNDDYRIMFHDREGALRRVVSRPYEPVPVRERDLRALFSYLDRAWIGAGVNPARLPSLHRQVHFEEFFPALNSVRMGPGGTLWIQRVQRPGDLSDEALDRYNFVEEFGSREWDVFDEEGRYMGIVTMPPRFQPRTFLGEVIYGVARDELDVPFVVRLRIVPGRGGP